MEVVVSDVGERLALHVGRVLTGGGGLRAVLFLSQEVRQPHHLAVAHQRVAVQSSNTTTPLT